MNKKEEIFEISMKLADSNQDKGLTARVIAKEANISRSNASRYLNELVKDGKMRKIKGRPVKYQIIKSNNDNVKKIDKIIGAESSLRISVQQAKAAILYPPDGLHTLLLGETGVGKSFFAKLMYNFAVEESVLKSGAPFVQFNCADYADNPQLLMGQLFGVKKGAYTGANKDSNGLLKNADGGMLFLDEVHRLPPQGQEMLFTFIDNGFFRMLGDTDKTIEADVKIVAATTESPGSYLLKTFQRRIPMVIELPALSERTLEERYKLIESFIKNEEKRVGQEILMYKNALKSFLLYDCKNNIGQLKSDIQLACAKSFLNYKSKNNQKIDLLKIGQEELPHHVKKGIMNLPDKRKELDDIIKNKSNLISFSNDININNNQARKPAKIADKNYMFYDVIEEKISVLEENGLNKNEISEILNIDIEKHFKNYIGDLPKNFKKSKIDKIVGEEIVSLVEEIFKLAENRLNRSYDEKIYYGLALHLKRSIARIKNGEKIYHPNLDEIRSDHSQEFITAMEIASMIDEKFSLKTPLDEIGYLSMFLTEKPYNYGKNDLKKVGILVIMHGRAAATSMTEVVNNLIGEQHAEAIDMPLAMNPQEAYQQAKDKVVDLNNGGGVLIMVDMGSLSSFGEMIEEETGVKTKTITMSSTPTILEASRKAVLGDELEDIIYSVEEIGKESYQQKFEKSLSFGEKEKIIDKKHKKRLAVVTACFTGDGAAVKLKDLLEEELELDRNFSLITLQLMNKDDLKKEIKELKSKYKVLAVVGTINFDIKDIQYFSAADIFTGDAINKLKKLIDREEMYQEMKKSLIDQFKYLDSFKIVEELRDIISRIENKLNKDIDSGIELGILLHMAYMIENVLAGGENNKFKNIEEYSKKNRVNLELLKGIVNDIEVTYNIEIDKNELAYILEMFQNN
ncbi:sigma 54 modulation protein [Halanaerobium saccharolyticum]|uniref:Sigma 54 modulation protein n=1 Tax=Halanaerobium saccharolyticum TaxID=43595 RepID=A0A4V3G5Z9_9FIRM|nr:sigma-54-dependent transcriptional regulator [Halanaerobium saccharolyticum]RAK11718.1 sigma 54 modulation protein [Halanaerobium saccharolyticum]TDW07559.1 sigma 54 modulation protein [Halanaerobium saccharolyticum]TDX64480.1 sigma 54 modulation protein [Halanaerobium saccharolyticum]